MFSFTACEETPESTQERGIKTVGDIVLAYTPEYEAYILHRVINITPDGYILKGDGNEIPDNGTFKKENIIGILK